MRYTEQEKTNMSIELESRRLDVNSSWLSPRSLPATENMAYTPRARVLYDHRCVQSTRSAAVTRAQLRAEEAVKKHQLRVKAAKLRRTLT